MGSWHGGTLPAVRNFIVVVRTDDYHRLCTQTKQ